MRAPIWLAALLFLAGLGSAAAQEIKGTVLDPTPDNLARTWNGASLVLPPALAGGKAWTGKLADAPAIAGRSPVVIVMHGSSGLAPAIREYQVWLAEQVGLASIAPDSLAIPDRLTYTSPISIELYERVHALRLAELENALARASALSWVDRGRIAVMGTSEGAVPVARLASQQPVARLIYAWSCERNYFVDQPRTAVPASTPVLAMISAQDPYFSPKNPWNASYNVTGNCQAAFATNKDARIVVVPSDQHTIINRPDVRTDTAAFLRRVVPSS
jgi:dienelactone hydrolase